MRHEVGCVFEGICHLGEGPLWNVKEQRLYWTDIFNKRIWVFDPADGNSRILWEGPLMVGGFAFTRRNSMVLCAEDGIYLLKNSRLEQLYHVPMQEREVFNDITTDPQGRIFAGTLTRGGGTGSLYRIEKGREPARLMEGISCSNGMTFSLDLKTFFHTDTGKRRVTAYDYDISTGKISGPRIFFQGRKEQGYPDGLTIDSRGYIWQAFWGAGLVRNISPSGKIAGRIKIPARQPSSVIFGGEKLKRLYITTSCQGATDLKTGMDENKGVFLGGKVYSCDLDVCGRAEWPADFD